MSESVGSTGARGLRARAGWALPLVPVALSGFLLSAMTWLRLQGDVADGARTGVQSFVVGLYRAFGFEPLFMVGVLVLTWSSIWFLTGRVDRPLARLLRIGALGLCLAILINLRIDGTAPADSGDVGALLATRMSSVFPPALSILLVAVAAVAALLLATDFFFYRYFESIGSRADARGRTSVAADEVASLEELRLEIPEAISPRASVSDDDTAGPGLDDGWADDGDDRISVETATGSAEQPGEETSAATRAEAEPIDALPEAGTTAVAGERPGAVGVPSAAEAVDDGGDPDRDEVDEFAAAAAALPPDDAFDDDWIGADQGSTADVIAAAVDEDVADEDEDPTPDAVAEDWIDDDGSDAMDEADAVGPALVGSSIGDDAESDASADDETPLQEPVDEEIADEEMADDEVADAWQLAAEDRWSDDRSDGDLSDADLSDGDLSDGELSDGELADEDLHADAVPDVEPDHGGSADVATDDAEAEPAEWGADPLPAGSAALTASASPTIDAPDAAAFAAFAGDDEERADLDDEVEAPDAVDAHEGAGADVTASAPAGELPPQPVSIEESEDSQDPSAPADEPTVELVPPRAHQSTLFGTAAADTELVDEARALVLEYRRASANFLKRRLRISTDDAMDLLQELARRGVVECDAGAAQGRVITDG